MLHAINKFKGIDDPLDLSSTVSQDDPYGNSGMTFCLGGGTVAPPVNPPLPPTNLNAETVLQNKINLNWTDNSDNDYRESGFEIQRGTASGSYTDLFTVNANITTFSDSGISANTTYFYRVRAYNDVGSSFSNEIEIGLIDNTPPSIESVNLTSTNSLVIAFNEPLDENSAGNIDNYNINNILITHISVDSSTVTLTTSDHSEENGGNYIITFSGIKDVYANTIVETSSTYTYSPTDTTQGLVGYWKLDENSGSQAFDSSQEGNAGELQEAVWSIGKFGSALSFNGEDAYVDFGDIDFGLTNEITISFWVKLNNHDEYSQRFFQKGQYVNPFQMRMKENKIDATLRTSTGVHHLYSDTTINIDEWYHVATTYKDGHQVLYINGQTDTSLECTGSLISNGSNNVMLGICPVSYSSPLDGFMDEIRIYNRELSADEIQALFINNNQGPPSEPTGVIILNRN